MSPANPLFRSFWMGGFECSSHINAHGVRLDMTAAVGHDVCASADYRRLAELGMLTARDGLRWHLIDSGGAYDWSSWIPMLEAAREQNVQVIWDLFHYGWPDWLDIFSAAFVDRFADFCAAAAAVHREHAWQPAWYSPVNEVNFFSWAASRGLMFPYALHRDGELKRQLIRAGIAAVQAIRSVEPEARFLSPEPLIHNVPPLCQPWNTGPALAQRNSQFEAWDMISGRQEPALGGREELLDVVGVNFYAANEWEVPGGRKLHWDAGSDDPRWMPLHKLLAEVYERYRRPMLIAETSHYGIGRADWLNEISAEAQQALALGVPLHGICLYPILDRFDWDDDSHWHNCGMWDLSRNGSGHYRRILHTQYAVALQHAQQIVG